MVSNRHGVFIIAEAGVNHNGSLAIAKKLVDAAVSCGADAIKFQTFKAESVISSFAPKAAYQRRFTPAGESQLEMVKKLELNTRAQQELMNYCKKKRICFLSSPFDLESIDFLNSLGLKIFKIPSGEIVNLPYLEKIGGLRKKIIMSTGMANMKEIALALKILIRTGTAKSDIIILHCNTEYPTPAEDANLKAMLAIKKACGVEVGYSDHTLGIEVAVAATALGAKVIEKHLTLDRDMPGPDHRSSLQPQQFKEMVLAIRNVEKAMGSCVKKPSHSEKKNLAIIRKSIVALTSIAKGERFSPANITTKRPGTGISPIMWHKVIGTKAKKSFVKDELIRL